MSENTNRMLRSINESSAILKKIHERNPKASKIKKIAHTIAKAYPDQLEWSIGPNWIELILVEASRLNKINLEGKPAPDIKSPGSAE